MHGIKVVEALHERLVIERRLCSTKGPSPENESRPELLKSIAPEFLSINTPQDRPANLASFNRNLKS